MHQDNYTLPKQRTFISREHLAPIAKTHKIKNLDSFFEKINSIAQVYEFNRRGFDRKFSKKEIRKSLSKVKKQALKLANTIDDLNEMEALWFWMAQRHVEVPNDKAQELMELKEHEHNVVEVFGSPIHVWGLKNGFQCHRMETDDIRKTISAIQQFAQYGMDKLPKGRDGRKSDHGLYMLIINLDIYWREGLGRVFSFDEHDGEGITPAYFFCKDIAQALYPSVTPTQVKTQMRKVISRR